MSDVYTSLDVLGGIYTYLSDANDVPLGGKRVVTGGSKISSSSALLTTTLKNDFFKEPFEDSPHAPHDFSQEEVELLRQEARLLLSHNEEMADAIDTICEANGWSRDDFIINRHKLTHLELFLLNFSVIPHIKYFLNLTVLSLMHISLKELDADDLVELKYLEVLWICENELTSIRHGGLKLCPKLKEVYAYSNLFSQLEFFLYLPELEILDISRNKISSLQGLYTLPKLRWLQVAQNNISSFDGCFYGSYALEEINLAGNSIKQFRQILCLGFVPKLRSLSFLDPVYGVNPVATMSNYQTFSLYNVPQIELLDGLYISQEQRELVKIMFSKKRVFYSMKLHFFLSNRAFLINYMRKVRRKYFANLQIKTNQLRAADARLILERKRVEIDINKNTNDKSGQRQSKEQLETVSSLVTQSINHKRTLKLTVHNMELACEEDIVLASVRGGSRILLDLHTGGNVRLDEGRPSDIWFQSCNDFLQTRFSPEAFSCFPQLGITGIQLSRVARVYNSALHNRFNQTLSSLVDVSDPSYKFTLDYLFFALPVTGFTRDLDGEEAMNNIVECGFRFLEPHAFISVTNSVFLAEQIRLQEICKSGEYKNNRKTLCGRLIVAKVFLGLSASEKVTSGTGSHGTNAPTARNSREFSEFVFKDGGGNGTGKYLYSGIPLFSAGKAPNKRDYTKDVLSVYRCYPQDSKQRIWYCFNDALVLPDYIIEFTYQSSNVSIPRPPQREWCIARAQDMATRLMEIFPNASNGELTDFRDMAPPLLSFLGVLNITHSISICEVDDDGTFVPTPGRRTISLASLSAEMDKALAAFDELHLSAEEPVDFVHLTLSGAALNTARDTGKLKNRLAGSDMLILSGCGIFNMSSLDGSSMWLSQITYLDLSDNKFSMLEGEWRTLAENLTSLHHLNLNSNNINGVPASEMSISFPELETLLLCHNKISFLPRLLGLRVMCPKLIVFDINQSSLMDDMDSTRDYVPYIVRVCCPSTLRLLNGIPVQKILNYQLWIHSPLELTCHDAFSAFEYVVTSATNISSDYFYVADSQLCMKRMELLGKVIDWLDIRCQNADFLYTMHTSDDVDQKLSEEQMFLLKHIPCLVFNNAMLSALPSKMIKECGSHLVYLQLRRHFISSLDAEVLRSMPLLEIVDLRYNCIAEIPPNSFSAMPSLKNLDLGYNCLKDVGDMCMTGTRKSGLNYLSLDHNHLTTMLPFISLTSIMELYLNFNDIEHETELSTLRELPKLIVLDLIENPCSYHENYRLYVIFHMKKLKVLDGIPIGIGEATLARDTFAGRVSAELLNEKIAPAVDWSIIVELNLSRCALKEIMLLESFALLKYLSVDHNFISDLKGVECATSLVSLNAAFNLLGGPSVGNALKSLKQLESLSLEANEVTSISSLELDLDRLKFLNLINNEIVEIDGLDHLSSLKELVLNRNRLRSLDRRALVMVAGLHHLYCDDNALKSISAIQALPYLTVASFNGNRLGDIQEMFRTFEGMPLEELSLLGNRVVHAPTYRSGLIHSMINTLKVLDRREVTEEEKHKVLLQFGLYSLQPQQVGSMMITSATAITSGVISPPPQAYSPMTGVVRDINGGGLAVIPNGGAAYGSRAHKDILPGSPVMGGAKGAVAMGDTRRSDQIKLMVIGQKTANVIKMAPKVQGSGNARYNILTKKGGV